MPKHSWEEFFPFSKIRDEQRLAINFAIDAFESGKEVVVLEMGTGCGKSATAITIARYFNQHGEISFDENSMPITPKTYILTTQKILQQQYVDDFAIANLKSASNYQCCYKEQSCAVTHSMLPQLKKNPIFLQKHATGCCPYDKDKMNFLKSNLSITNFAYFLNSAKFGTSIAKRDLLIIDEAHNIEQELTHFVEIKFSIKFASMILGITTPDLVKNVVYAQECAYKWICNEYIIGLNNYIKMSLKDIEQYVTDNNTDSVEFTSFSKKFEALKRHASSVETFIAEYDHNNWIMNIVIENGTEKLQFKPINVSAFSKEALFSFGKRILLMSATIINNPLFCHSIGLNHWNSSYLNVPSPFKAENKPIHHLPVGSMSLNFINSTLPKLVEAISILIENHKTEKGIIHCVNYKIAQYILNNVKTKRFLIHDSKNREEILQKHIASKKPTILLSPSMMEGVDLVGDISRFQILCKLPFPYLGDAVIKRKMEQNRNWYVFQTVKSIIQSLGRSIRNDNDYAISYILDEDFTIFYAKNKNMFPRDFKIT
jgi:ATP-dependent DNA helicase DinG